MTYFLIISLLIVTLINYKDLRVLRNIIVPISLLVFLPIWGAFEQTTLNTSLVLVNLFTISLFNYRKISFSVAFLIVMMCFLNTFGVALNDVVFILFTILGFDRIQSKKLVGIVPFVVGLGAILYSSSSLLFIFLALTLFLSTDEDYYQILFQFLLLIITTPFSSPSHLLVHGALALLVIFLIFFGHLRNQKVGAMSSAFIIVLMLGEVGFAQFLLLVGLVIELVQAFIDEISPKFSEKFPYKISLNDLYVPSLMVLVFIRDADLLLMVYGLIIFWNIFKLIKPFDIKEKKYYINYVLSYVLLTVILFPMSWDMKFFGVKSKLILRDIVSYPSLSFYSLVLLIFVMLVSYWKNEKKIVCHYVFKLDRQTQFSQEYLVKIFEALNYHSTRSEKIEKRRYQINYDVDGLGVAFSLCVILFLMIKMVMTI